MPRGCRRRRAGRGRGARAAAGGLKERFLLPARRLFPGRRGLLALGLLFLGWLGFAGTVLWRLDPTSRALRASGVHRADRRSSGEGA